MTQLDGADASLCAPDQVWNDGFWVWGDVNGAGVTTPFAGGGVAEKR